MPRYIKFSHQRKEVLNDFGYIELCQRISKRSMPEMLSYWNNCRREEPKPKPKELRREDTYWLMQKSIIRSMKLQIVQLLTLREVPRLLETSSSKPITRSHLLSEPEGKYSFNTVKMEISLCFAIDIFIKYQLANK